MAETWQIRVRGLVQGVGFRPFVWKLARGMGLRGDVRNDGEGVIVRLEAPGPLLEAFRDALRAEAPPLARIDAVEVRPLVGAEAEEWQGFSIIGSGGGAVRTGILPDAATCADCLDDISDPASRRAGYAFTNCTNCGPRLSIIRAIPYDRANTSMAEFEMCGACREEYENPADRRFHAQPNACPECGPRLWLEDESGPCAGDPIAAAAAAIRAGGIVAIKGIGGFQLAVDATSEEAVARLRRRKRRPGKPLAVMVRDLEMARRHARLGPEAEEILKAPSAPIVLLPPAGAPLAEGIAPGQGRLGIMLPNTPLHHLLMRALEGPIVLTSGNVSGEPQIIANEAARAGLAGIADLWLMHDREIVNRVDDGVVQIVAGRPQILRRARGEAPAPLLLHPGFSDAPPVLAVGGDLKNTYCLLDGGQAIVSQHMGDMENPLVQRDFRRNLALFRAAHDFTPAVIATDMHPGYFATRLGAEEAGAAGADLVAVQHHHAHVASVMAEHGLAPDAPPVLAIVLDGLGHGPDGAIWGGEFLLAGFHGFRRLRHFAPVPLPGGDKANRQPWRNALAHLICAFGPDAIAALGESHGDLPALKRLGEKPVEMIAQMVHRGLNAPPAASAGRLFDAVAAMLGIAFEAVEYEGEAAMRLQALAESCPGESGSYAWEEGESIGWAPLWEGVLADLADALPPARIAARFHNTLIRLLIETGTALARRSGAERIVLSGGVMQNALLLEGAASGLAAAGFEILQPRSLPANDGGLSLGQAAIAAAAAMRPEAAGPDRQAKA